MSDCCTLCGRPISPDDRETASDGEMVHARCESEYEDNVYHRESFDDEPREEAQE